jgi:hypothetical protein
MYVKIVDHLTYLPPVSSQTSFEDLEKIYKELKVFSKKYNCVILTAKAPPIEVRQCPIITKESLM